MPTEYIILLFVSCFLGFFLYATIEFVLTVNEIKINATYPHPRFDFLAWTIQLFSAQVVTHLHPGISDSMCFVGVNDYFLLLRLEIS